MSHMALFLTISLLMSLSVQASSLHPQTCEGHLEMALSYCRSDSDRDISKFNTCQKSANRDYQKCTNALAVRGLL